MISDVLSQVEAVIPATWCPDRPLTERIAKLVQVRSKFLQLFQIEQSRANSSEVQRTSMRKRYLGMLVYAQRVCALEFAVSRLLEDAERNGAVDMRFVKALAEAHDHLGDAISVDPPDDMLASLEPFLRGKHGTIVLTGSRLEAFRAVVRWIHGMVED